MPVFVWEGRNASGEVKKGEMEAKNAVVADIASGTLGAGRAS